MAQIATVNYPSPTVGQTGSVNWQANQIRPPISGDPSDRYGGVPTLRLYNDSGCTLLIQMNNGYQFTMPPRERVTMPCPLDIYSLIWTVQGIVGTGTLPNLYVDLFQPNDPLPQLGGAGGSISAADVLPGTFPAGLYIWQQAGAAAHDLDFLEWVRTNDHAQTYKLTIGSSGNLELIDVTSGVIFATFQGFGGGTGTSLAGNLILGGAVSTIAGTQITAGAFGVPPIIGSATAAPSDATLDTILTVTAPATGLYRVSFAGFRLRSGNGNVTAETTYTDQGAAETAFFSTNAGIVLNAHAFTLPAELACTAIILQADTGTAIAVKFQDTGVAVTANPLSVIIERLI